MSTTKKQMLFQAGQLPRPCVFSRYVEFVDSINLLGFSLDAVVKSIHEARMRNHKSLDELFPTAKLFCQSKNYGEEEFKVFCSGKINFPHSLATNFEEMQKVTEIPSPDKFASELRNTETASPESYQFFCDTWRMFNCKNLMDFIRIYNISDTALYADACSFIFNELFQTTGLWISHFKTVASFALESFLYNSRQPNQPHKRLFIPYLDQGIFEDITNSCLNGGFSSNQCIFSTFNFGALVPANEAEVEAGIDYGSSTVTFPQKLDYNCLYPSSLINDAVPFKNLTNYDRESNSPTFAMLEERILELDFDFFVDELEKHKNGYMIELTVNFDLESSLTHSIDLGGLPWLKFVSVDELSSDQASDANRLKKNLNSEGPRLVSSHEQGHRFFDFVGPVFYSLAFLSFECVLIHRIVKYKAANILGDYLEVLQAARNTSPSKLLNSVYKVLGNSLPGSSHLIKFFINIKKNVINLNFS